MKTHTAPFTIIPNRDVFLTLNLISQSKVEYIYMIAVIAHNSGIRPMDQEEFDYLYDKDLEDLHHYTMGFKQHEEYRQLVTMMTKGRSA